MSTDQRAADALRPIRITRGFTQAPAGSVLWQQGRTIVLCTASVTPELPPWFGPNRAGGWITAEYVMLPGSTPQRKGWPRIGHTDSRGTEIQRIIGRALRAVIDLSRIGPNTIAVDCQVLQADGGTRTACISAAYVALADAIRTLPRELPSGDDDRTARPWQPGVEPAEARPSATARAYDPAHALVDQLAAVSVGVVDGQLRLDLDYPLDSRAQVDMNVAATASGRLVEIQSSAENGQGFDRATLDALLDLALRGCEQILSLQRDCLSA